MVKPRMWLTRVFRRCFPADSIYLFWIRLGGSRRCYFSFFITKITNLLTTIKLHHSLMIILPLRSSDNYKYFVRHYRKLFFIFLVFPGSPIYFSDFLVDCSKLLLCPPDGSFIMIHMSYCGFFKSLITCLGDVDVGWIMVINVSSGGIAWFEKWFPFGWIA